ncbi:MAG: 50S ribosomal protein L6 [bacterium]
MSRIGKRIVKIPSGVQLSVVNRLVQVKGPKGELNVSVPLGIAVNVEGEELTTVPADKTKAKLLSPLLGLTNSLITNAIIGVTEGFSKRLELSGVGYRAKKTETGLSMTLGFSHPVEFELPAGIEATVTDNTKITISGIDKQLVGLVSAKIRKLKKPEPYKGKGIKYVTEVVRRKAGKAGKVQK